jgi:hypothetical protein
VAGEEAGAALLAHQCIRRRRMVDTTKRKKERKRDKHPEYFILHFIFLRRGTPLYNYLFVVCAVYQHVLPNNNPWTRSHKPSLPLELKQGDTKVECIVSFYVGRDIKCDAHSV